MVCTWRSGRLAMSRHLISSGSARTATVVGFQAIVIVHGSYNPDMADAIEENGPDFVDAASCRVLSIGYGSVRTTEQLVELLRREHVRYLVDVRTKPYSRFRPEYSREALEAILRRAAIQYVFMGDSLGGLPSDPSCYTGDKVDYDKVRDREWFCSGIERLESGWKSGHRLAVMCSELEPERCHRSKLIGEALVARAVAIGHIDETGSVVSQQAVMNRLTGGQGALFEMGLTSRKAYRPKGAAPESSG